MDRRISNRKWFYPLIYFLIILLIFVPPYASKGYSYEEIGKLTQLVLSVSLEPYHAYAPIFHLATLALLAAVWKYGNRARRMLTLYIGLDYLFIAFAQGTAHTEEFGFAILTGNLISMAFVGILWLWETVRPRMDVTFRRLPWWRYWPAPLALFAFWCPAGKTLEPYFNPLLLLTSIYGLAFCMTTPVVVFLLTLFYPRVNEVVYRVTAFVGLLFSLLNMQHFSRPGGWWMGVLHFPLLFISIYALLLPRMVREEEAKEIE